MPRIFRPIFLILYFVAAALFLFSCNIAKNENPAEPLKRLIYDPGELEPIISSPIVHVGDIAPDFNLPSVSSSMTLRHSLSEYKGKKNVVLSFVPAAWTPICSIQWPGYCASKDMFEKYDAVLLGIASDNVPTLYAWTIAMENVWFPVLSDFWPHGEVASEYGVLRSDGVAERALFVIDKEGIVRHVKVYNINTVPDIAELERFLSRM